MLPCGAERLSLFFVPLHTTGKHRRYLEGCCDWSSRAPASPTALRAWERSAQVRNGTPSASYSDRLSAMSTGALGAGRRIRITGASTQVTSAIQLKIFT